MIDQLLDMGRTATNILGNAIAVAVIGRGHTHPDEEMEEILQAGPADSTPEPALSAAH